MTNEIKSADAEADSQNTANLVGNMSPSEFIQRRIEKSKRVEQSKPTEEEISNESVEESNTTEEVVKESAPKTEVEDSNTEDVLSQFDLDTMSDQELKDISDKLGSRAVARFGELTARRKAAEERIVSMEKQITDLQTKRDRNVPVVKNNPLSNITDPKKLQEEAKSAQEVLDWAEDLLFEKGDGYGPDDIISTISGKEVTKADVRKSLKNSQNMLRKYIPAQMHTLRKKHEAVQAKTAFEARAKKELDWMNDPKHEMFTKYQAMVTDRRLVEVNQKHPELGAQLPYLVAHAANSLYNNNRVPIADTGKGVKLNPPRTASTTAATPEKKQSNSSKQIDDLATRFKKSGNKNDFITLRTLQMQNKT